MLWDIFCKVIDNHGDIGVAWRLSAQLAARGQSIRLWVDDASALAWMAPQGLAAIQVLPWDAQQAARPGDVVVEAFGCDPSPAFLSAMVMRAREAGRQPPWINLEYLTAQPFALRNHSLASPLLAGPAAGLTRHFFYPGFSDGTGGLLREPGLMERQSAFDADRWLEGVGVRRAAGATLVSLFCYEPPALEALLAMFARGPGRTQLLVTAGRAASAVADVIAKRHVRDPDWNGQGLLVISWLPLLSQVDFDHLLWACELNFVRGEDSLVRALWAGKPLVWQIYPQHDDAHHAKLDAFLDWLPAPASLRTFHRAWNGIAPAQSLEPWTAEWLQLLRDARDRLLNQQDLVTQLMRFVAAA